MERTAKSWGEKWNIFRNDLCEISFLKLKHNQRCSWHSHISKFNLFFVINGCIEIKTEDGISTLSPGQCFTTYPGEMHEFRVLCDSQIIEIMYVQYNPDDILRQKAGGPIFQLESNNDGCKEGS